MSGFRYRLFSSAGDELGEFLTGDGRRFRIVAIVPVLEEDSPYSGFFEVEPVGGDD